MEKRSNYLYFDMLPDDIIDMLLRISKDLRIARHISGDINKRYISNLDLIDKGCIMPDDYFEMSETTYFGSGNYDTVNIDGVTVTLNRQIKDLISDITSEYHSYLYDIMADYSGHLYSVSRVNKSLVDKLLELSNLQDKRKFNSDVYVLVEVHWDSIGGEMEMSLNDKWKDFWNMYLSSHHRYLIKQNNKWI